MDIRTRVYNATLGKLKKRLQDDEGLVRQGKWHGNTDTGALARAAQKAPTQRRILMNELVKPTASRIYRGAQAGSRVLNPGLRMLQKPNQSILERNIDTLRDVRDAAGGVATVAGLSRLPVALGMGAFGTGISSAVRKFQGQDVNADTLFQDTVTSLNRSIPVAGTLRFTSPFLKAGVERLTPKIAGPLGGAVAERATRSALNVGEGLVIDQTTGLPTTMSSMALDAAFGLAGGNGRALPRNMADVGASAIAKGVLTEKERTISEAYSILRENNDLIGKTASTIDDQVSIDNAERAIREAHKEIFRTPKGAKTAIGDIIADIQDAYDGRVLPKLEASQGYKMGIAGEPNQPTNFTPLPDARYRMAQDVPNIVDANKPARMTLEDVEVFNKVDTKLRSGGRTEGNEKEMFEALAKKYLGGINVTDANKAQVQLALRKMANLGGLGSNSQAAFGLMAGIEPERDDEGNFTGVGFNPYKAVAGVAVMGGIKSVRGKQSIEDALEGQSGWKPGMKQQFDMALFSKDKKAVKEMLKDVPEEYISRFRKELADLGVVSTKGGNIDLKVPGNRKIPLLDGQGIGKGASKGGGIPPIPPTPRVPSSSYGNDTPRMTTIQDVERELYGSETGVKTWANMKDPGILARHLRQLEAGSSSLVSKGLESTNPIIRGAASLMQDLMGGAGKTSEQIATRGQYRGGIDYGTKLASDAQNHVYDLVGRNKKSLDRVHAVLDPNISKLKVKEANLTGAEKEALGTLRILSDFVNDTNYSNGFITKDQWMSHRGGKYIARAYEEFDFPPEMAEFMKNKDMRFDLNPFKKREELTNWKIDNAITDPAYLMSKRIQQTLFNNEVKNYTTWAQTAGLTSDTAKPGFVQLSDSKAYGPMAGKWIRKDALEDVKGFFVTNDVGQKAYDVLNWYDRNPVRRSQKMLKTVFNPAVRLGNRTGNYVFAWLNGINPVTFEKNRRWAGKAIKENDPLYRYAVQQGITGTDVTKADIVRMSTELSKEIKEPGMLKKAIEELQNSYGRVDDTAKIGALKTWIDRGVEPTEAVNRVRRGFQDYNMVGFLYDLGAKFPILGNPFVRFASESIRIAKNAAVDHPLRTIATISAFKLFGDVMSRYSGERPEDRELREQRVGASHLPFTDISANIMTPWGEVNVSRLLGFSTTYTPENDNLADLSKYAPFQNPMDKRNYGSDPMIGPLISLGTDTDFRGKSIADPDQSKYMASTLTPLEQNMNRAGFLARAYLPPTATDAYNIKQAVEGKPNVYGQNKTPTQAVLRMYPGIKVEQYGPEQAQIQRERNTYFDDIKNDQIRKQINAVRKQELKGEIDGDTARKRIDSLNKKITVLPGSKSGVSADKPYAYIDENGDMKNIDLTKLNKTPTSATAKARLEKDKFEKAVQIYRNENIPQEDKDKLIDSLGLDQKDLEYYDLASEDTSIRSIAIMEEISSLQSTSSDRGDMLRRLAELRREVSGQRVLTDNIISDLVSEELLTKEEGKILKDLKYDMSGQLRVKTTGRGKGAKLKKIKFVPQSISYNSTLTPIKPSPQLRLQTPQGGFSTPRIQVAVPTVPQSPKYQVKFNL